MSAADPSVVSNPHNFSAEIPGASHSNIFHDLRLRAVQWRDLVPVAPLEILFEPLLPALWLGASLMAAEYGDRLSVRR
jgi:hypothetical protein